MTRHQGSPSGNSKDKSHSPSASLSSYSGGQHLSHALRLSSTSLSSKLSRNSTCLPRLLGEVRPQLTCPGTLRMPGGGSTTRRTRDGVARRVGGKGGGVGEAGLR